MLSVSLSPLYYKNVSFPPLLSSTFPSLLYQSIRASSDLLPIASQNQTIFSCLSNHFPIIFPQNISKAAFSDMTFHLMPPTFHSCIHDLISDCYQTWVCLAVRSRTAHMQFLHYWLKIKSKNKERRLKKTNSLSHWGSYSVQVLGMQPSPRIRPWHATVRVLIGGNFP